MSMLGGSGARIQMMQKQADSVTIIAAPVSTTKYEWLAGETGAGAALGTQKNVKIISIDAKITWATTQPTPLDVIVTINGITVNHLKADPVTATDYYACLAPFSASNAQYLETTPFTYPFYTPSPLHEGRSIKIEVAITWATTQPTNLTVRVKWAKIP